ncbi:hypothetical protein BV898_13586, partial [Hypsibius exemplaris]
RSQIQDQRLHCPRINTGNPAISMMARNIVSLQDACKKEGWEFRKRTVFQTACVDLVGNVPYTSPKDSSERTRICRSSDPASRRRTSRDFTEEQLRAGKDVISLHIGSNQGRINQVGQNFGNSRHM